MNADGSEDVRVGCAEDDRHGRPGGDTCHVDAGCVDCPLRCVLKYVLDNADDHGWFAMVTRLVGQVEPVPTIQRVVLSHLLWIDND